MTWGLEVIGSNCGYSHSVCPGGVVRLRISTLPRSHLMAALCWFAFFSPPFYLMLLDLWNGWHCHQFLCNYSNLWRQYRLPCSIVFCIFWTWGAVSSMVMLVTPYVPIYKTKFKMLFVPFYKTRSIISIELIIFILEYPLLKGERMYWQTIRREREQNSWQG